MEEDQGSGRKRGKSSWSITEGKERGKEKGDVRLTLCRGIFGKNDNIQHYRSLAFL